MTTLFFSVSKILLQENNCFFLQETWLRPQHILDQPERDTSGLHIPVLLQNVDFTLCGLLSVKSLYTKRFHFYHTATVHVTNQGRISIASCINWLRTRVLTTLYHRNDSQCWATPWYANWGRPYTLLSRTHSFATICYCHFIRNRWIIWACMYS
jgi:hypothetical protein